ncbi:MAG: imidazolonepropionase, partial [Ferruginibacter sp.]
MTTLITHIKQLHGCRQAPQLLRGAALADLPFIENAYLLVEDGLIADYGAMHDLDWKLPALPKDIIDASGQMILPCWCDSHTHLVFAGSRENEFRDKIEGVSYAEIAARGGGILNSARKLNETSEDSLYAEAYKR